MLAVLYFADIAAAFAGPAKCLASTTAPASGRLQPSLVSLLLITKLPLFQRHAFHKWSHSFLGIPPLQDLSQPQRETVLSQ